jgi:hypothetical protein
MVVFYHFVALSPTIGRNLGLFFYSGGFQCSTVNDLNGTALPLIGRDNLQLLLVIFYKIKVEALTT